MIPLGEEKPHGGWGLLISILQLLILAEGCAGVLVTGLELTVQPWIWYTGTGVLTAALSLFFYGDRLQGYRRYGLLACALGYLTVLFLSREIWQQGGAQLWNCVLDRMNEHYGSGLPVQPVDIGEWTMTWFLLELLFPLLLLLGAVTVYRPDGVLLGVLLFPLLTLLLLVGGSPQLLPLFLLLTGSVTVCVSARSVCRQQLWGAAGSRQFERNSACCENIRRKTILISSIAVVVLAVPGFWLMRPVLKLQLSGAEQMTAEVEGRLMGALVNLLPQLSGGNVDLRVEGVGGGVEDGAILDAEGYRMQGIEDLMITCTAQPRETIYLKGFIGSAYDHDRWLAMDGASFDRAAGNWKVEEAPRLYIQNLPFLRALYAWQEASGNDGDGQAGTAGNGPVQELTVERINANPAYTYAPYYAYYNSYYEVECGDGYVAGQSQWEDIFSYYPREDYLQQIEDWNADEDHSSVLDDIEASYEGYVRAHYLDVPEGFEELWTVCEAQDLDGTEPEDMEEITAYIRNFLRQGYTYRLDPPGAPEGEDALQWFVTDGRTGSSMHFASAATLMFRMFGVPARYVVGYAAPRNLFTPQPDGTYTAVLQDDNSHAWTEIYREGVGWIPVEVTPGEIGVAEEVTWQGERAEAPEDAAEAQDTTEAAGGEGAENDGEDRTEGALLFRGDLESLICWLTLIMGAGTLLWGGIYLVCRIRRDYGWGGTCGRKCVRSEGERILDIFQAYYRRMCRLGMASDVEASTGAFRRAVSLYHPGLSERELDHMLRLVFESSYSAHRMTEADVTAMRRYYRSLQRCGCFLRKGNGCSIRKKS